MVERGEPVGVQGRPAFLPDPLPPVGLDYGEVVNAVAEAEHALGRLAGVGRTLTNPYLVAGPLLFGEALASSRMDNVSVTSQEALLQGVTHRDVHPGGRVVMDYAKAMVQGIGRLDGASINLQFVVELHSVLVGGSGSGSVGGSRKGGANTSDVGQDPLDQAFTPSETLGLSEALRQLDQFIQTSDAPLLVRLALIHYQFEAICPFREGSGRIARMLIPLILGKAGRQPQPLYYMSSYFIQRQTEYVDLLLQVSRQGAWRDWIAFFLRGVERQSAHSLVQIDKLVALRNDWLKRAKPGRSSTSPHKLIDALFRFPATTVGQAQKLLGVTPRGAKLNIEKLVDQGILHEATERRRNRVFTAGEILQIIEPTGP